jgi:hypothetical protein
LHTALMSKVSISHMVNRRLPHYPSFSIRSFQLFQLHFVVSALVSAAQFRISATRGFCNMLTRQMIYPLLAVVMKLLAINIAALYMTTTYKQMFLKTIYHWLFLPYISPPHRVIKPAGHESSTPPPWLKSSYIAGSGSLHSPTFKIPPTSLSTYTL